jgi:hypothetical protein
VVTDAGQPVGGALVLISRSAPANILLPASAKSGPPVVTGTLAAKGTTDASGAFSIGNLAAGQYVACAEAAAPGLLDPCHWSASAPTFTVAAGQNASGLTITVTRGAVLTIQLADPRGLLTPATGPIDFRCQIHIVTSRGIHYAAPIQSSAVGGRSHAITIPYGTPVALQLLAPHLVLIPPGAPFRLPERPFR